jgi:uncharacterized protein (TIGR02231 family)
MEIKNQGCFMTTQTLNAPIMAVTVFPDRARITRTGTIALESGEQSLVIPNLPMALDADSVRVDGRGNGVRLLNVEVRTSHLADAPEREVTTLREQIEGLRQQDAALEDDQERIKSQLRTLGKLRDQAGKGFGRSIANGRTSFDDYTALVRQTDEETAALQAHQRELDQQREALAKQIAALEQQIEQLQPVHRRRTQQRREIHILINATQNTEARLEIIYGVHGAHWQPVYDLRLSEAEVTLTYLATVTQRTGESWDGVQLALSTARPAQSLTLPELHPQYVAPPTPPRPLAASAPMMRQAAAPRLAKFAETSTMEQAVAYDSAPIEVETAQVESSEGAAVTYQIHTPVSIPSDGTPYKTTITVERLKVDLDYLIVPKLAAEAYIRATITNTSATTLLPGDALIYHGDAFVGKTRLKTVVSGEKFETQLGVDDRIRVKRELVQRDMNKRLIGGNRQVYYKYKITLKNLLPTPAKMTVTDQIPVGGHEQIKVKLSEATPAPVEQTPLNLLKWELTLRPDEQREIFFAYTVESAAEMNVVGLE